MKTVLWLCAIFLVDCSAAVAQSHLLALQQLQKDLTSRNESLDPSHSTVLIMFPAPLIIDPSLGGPDSVSATGKLLLVTDTAPLPSVLFASSSRTTYKVYETIIQNRAPEPWKLSPEKESQLKAADRVLLKQRCIFVRLLYRIRGKELTRVPSKKYLRYREYAHKVSVLKTEMASATSDQQRHNLQVQIDDVDAEWRGKGHKDEVSAAIANDMAIRATDPEKFWSTVGNQYLVNSLTANGMRFPVTKVNPPPNDWISDSGWQQWSFGNSTGGLKSVAIIRAWLNIDVLTSHPWSWGPGVYRREGVLVSDGIGLSEVAHRNELMPLLPVSILLGRRMTSLGQVLTTGDDPVILGLVCRVLPRLPPQ